MCEISFKGQSSLFIMRTVYIAMYIYLYISVYTICTHTLTVVHKSILFSVGKINNKAC